MADKDKDINPADNQEESKDSTAEEQEFNDQELQEVAETEIVDLEELAEGESEASFDNQLGSNTFLREMMDQNFIEYASYVIKERAIPDVDDGLKPVQRRILWSLFRMNDGKFHKVANVIGHTMQFHPHGDASIGAALVVLSNKDYFIEKQGNFGNIYTGDAASAARYIECRLSPLGLEVLFNNDITKFIDSYDGRNQEPVVLPVKIPSLLMLGAEGIAVGMSTKILPHNFSELLQAQISCLRGEPFELYPDFLQGGRIDVSEYEEGNGKILIRSKIDRDGRKLIIREIPAITTTESLIASVERAVERSKIKIASINDYTAEEVEIEIVPTRGQDPNKMLKALYAYTDCSVSVSCNMMIIKENNPVQMNVSQVVRRNTEKLLEYLKLELEIELGKLEDMFHAKTLAQIFIENRIYKLIEECDSFEKVMAAVYKGLEPFLDKLKREVVDDDIQKLLAIPIRRISLFDIRKNQKELDEILAQIDQIHKHLKRLKSFAIKYLTNLLEKYGHLFPRRTEIEEFKKIDRAAVALNNIRIGWDRKNCYVGTAVKSDDTVLCNEYDHLLCIERKGSYKVINLVDKLYVGRLYDFRKYDPSTEFGVIYKEKKTGKTYVKRTVIDKFITDRQYRIVPKGCRLEMLTPRADAIYEITEELKRDQKAVQINLKDYPLRSPKARGLLLTSRPVSKITHVRYLTEEELNEFNSNELTPPEEAVAEINTPAAPAEIVEVIEETQDIVVDEIKDSIDEIEKADIKENDKVQATSPDNEEIDQGKDEDIQSVEKTEKPESTKASPTQKEPKATGSAKGSPAVSPKPDKKSSKSKADKQLEKEAAKKIEKKAETVKETSPVIVEAQITEKAEAAKETFEDVAIESIDAKKQIEEIEPTQPIETEQVKQAEPEKAKEIEEEATEPENTDSENTPQDGNSTDEWGIIQPDFGF
ncbi:MAG: DNA topoisomerase IV subunit A [Lentisphaerae bacterium]|nr:DNA topoisomerase IV subunit A [Lentisphaerota bacterium]MCP4102308.1 DNA topoisomerase IV subunit A [Lentisphaerota bacterium]